MGELRQLVLAAAEIPEDVKIRHVKRLVMSEDGEKLLRTEIDTPPASYFWVVQIGKTVAKISGDHHLPCILGDQENPGEVVGTITKMRLTGLPADGDRDVCQSQLDAWIAAGVPGLE